MVHRIFGIIIVIILSNSFATQKDIRLIIEEHLLESKKMLETEIVKLNREPTVELIQLLTLDSIDFIPSKKTSEAWLARAAASSILGNRKDKSAIISLENIFNFPLSPFLGNTCFMAKTEAAKAIVKIEMDTNSVDTLIAKALIKKLRLYFCAEKSEKIAIKINFRGKGTFSILAELGEKNNGVRHLFLTGLNDTNECFKINMIKLLSISRDKRALEPLLQILKNKNNSVNVRREVCWALIEFEDPKVLKALHGIAKDKTEDKDIVVYSIRAIGRIGNEESANVLIELENSADKKMNCTVLESACKIGGKKLTPLIIKALNSKDENLSFEAEKALRKNGMSPLMIF
jgi:HEAT repeat protein